MVLVHGLGVSGHYLVPTARALARWYPVCVPDLPGAGHSDDPDHALTIPELADALAGWADSLGLPPAVYLGNSLGCQIIVDLALRRPALVERAVLVGPTVDPEGRTLIQQAGRALLDWGMEPFSLWPILLRDYLRAGPWRVLRTFQHALADPIAHKLPAVRQPVLLVRGSLDSIVPRPWLERMHRLLPEARLAVLPHATHATNWSAPEALARLVCAFFEGPAWAVGERGPER
jgi:2-hydroxy-6-oxonona-2,4-dienedioate hydrolase